VQVGGKLVDVEVGFHESGGRGLRIED
jgi:hypothetical protein